MMCTVAGQAHKVAGVHPDLRAEWCTAVQALHESGAVQHCACSREMVSWPQEDDSALFRRKGTFCRGGWRRSATHNAFQGDMQARTKADAPHPRKKAAPKAPLYYSVRAVDEGVTRAPQCNFAPVCRQGKTRLFLSVIETEQLFEGGARHVSYTFPKPKNDAVTRFFELQIEEEDECSTYGDVLECFINAKPVLRQILDPGERELFGELNKEVVRVRPTEKLHADWASHRYRRTPVLGVKTRQRVEGCPIHLRRWSTFAHISSRAG